MKKFECSVVINQPLGHVVALFENPDNLSEWQDGFKSYTHDSGEKGQPGAKSTFLYEGRGGEMEILETIIRNDLPEEFMAEYWHKHMTNTMRYWFEALGPNETRYAAEVHYTEARGFMIKLMMTLFPSMFRKQVQKWMDQFKAFAERTPAAESINR